MGKKFIPNGDGDFAAMAVGFAGTIAADPGRFEVPSADSAALSAAVDEYLAKLEPCRTASRSVLATLAKDEARAAAERIVRRIAHLLRLNGRLDAATRTLLGIRTGEQKPKARPCPQEPPQLHFVRALHESGATPVHELAFTARDDKKAKPAGAVRLELFVDLIPPDEPIPTHPGANHGSRPWYLRSYTRSPIRLTPPIAGVPMRVVYWGRWADSVGNVGPFGATAVAWIEGGSHFNLPGGVGIEVTGARKPVREIEDLSADGPARRGESYRVAVLEVRYGTMTGREPMPALPDARRPRQLEGPAEVAA